MREALLNSQAVAQRFGVSVHTVARWAREGLLPAIRTPGGRLRFRDEDVERFVKDQEPAA